MEETPRIDLDTKFIPGTRRLIAFRTHLFDDFIRHDGEGTGRRQAESVAKGTSRVRQRVDNAASSASTNPSRALTLFCI